MTPNLFLATQKAFSPHKWFKNSNNNSERSTKTIEEWSTPVPGLYEYTPGRGWYLIAIHNDASLDGSEYKTSSEPLSRSSSFVKEYTKLAQPIQVHKSKVLSGRWFLDGEYKARKRQGTIRNDRDKLVTVGFFQLDDGVTWVQCWDAFGKFIPGDPAIGGYKRWCIDANSKNFRHMLKRDDPNYIRSRSNSPANETHSQDSMSTILRSAAPSTVSTRPNSIRYMSSNAASRAPSRVPSRQNSPERNGSIALEEAKAALRRMAKEQEDASKSKAKVEQVELRGRKPAAAAN